ncbi:hypothetical protein [Variovorax sp. W2I14]|uniref:hypothetical protein n=1 Tax=Variovorax sp. W2I14 TaxID=3042290 RepID=UPI003D1B7185
MSYQTITETFSTIEKCSGQDFDYEVSLRFTPLGLTQYGTFIVDDNPTDEELSIITDYKANWAVEYRFEDFKAQVKDWAKLQVFIEAIQDQRPDDIEEAQLFLQAEDWDSPITSADQLQLFKTFNAWEAKQALSSGIAQAPKAQQTKRTSKI